MKRCALALCVAAFLALPAAAQERYWVEMEDGVQLATDLYTPDTDAPWPVVLFRTPYEIDRPDMAMECELYRSNGIACAIQNQRGFEESQGEFEWWIRAREDGHATVTWIAEQPWSNGHVGTSGASALGEAQYRLAPAAPDSLTSIAPSIASPDFYHHVIFQGGVLREALVYAVAEAFGWEVDVPPRLLDEWWDPLRPVLSVDQITVPGLHIGGWWDVYSQGTLDGFSKIQEGGGDGARGHQKLVMGPWVHGFCGTTSYIGQLVFPENSKLDVSLMELQWNSHWLLGDNNGVDEWPTALVYLMGAAFNYFGIPQESNVPGNTWVELDQWPPPAVDLELYLDSQGALHRSVMVSEQVELLIDPDDPVPTNGGAAVTGPGPRDQREIEARDDVLVFSTDELTHPLTVMGRISVHLWIVPDTTDLDLAVRLSDVYPSGHSMLVTDGIQRARMRCSDEYECFLTPGEPTEIIVDLWSTAMVFNRGHKVRISVSGSNWSRFEVNPNHGGDFDGDEVGIIARPQVLFGADYPSRLVLPVPITEPRRVGGRVGGGAP